jgi:hypothetical protein
MGCMPKHSGTMAVTASMSLELRCGALKGARRWYVGHDLAADVYSVLDEAAFQRPGALLRCICSAGSGDLDR